MKKAKIIASVVLAAAIGATVISTAGCGGKSKGKEFNIENYAHALDSKYVESRGTSVKLETHKARTAGVKKDYTEIIPLSDYTLNRNFARATVKGDVKDTYTLYDVEKDKELFKGKDYIIATDTLIILCTYKNVSETTYQLVAPDGKLLVNKVFDDYSGLALENEGGLTDADGNPIQYYSFTYTDNNRKLKKYFSYSKDEDGEIIWNETTEEAVKAAFEAGFESDYSAGEIMGADKALLEFVEYGDSNYADYTVSSVEGSGVDVYTYYKEGRAVGSITVEMGDIVGYVGNYVYYYENEPVSVDATRGYNFELLLGFGMVLKYNQTLYRYDFINGAKKAEKVNTDYVFLGEGLPLYNYADKTFDRLFIGAIKKVNGVAVGYDDVDYYSLLLDENFNISLDLSGKDFSTSGIYKLSDNRYLTGRTIYDGELNVVAQFPKGSTVRIWEEQNLLRVYYRDNTNNDYMYAYVDYDGKVVIGPVSTNAGMGAIYGDAVVIGTTRAGKVYNRANPSGITIEKLIEAADEDDIEVRNGIIIKTEENSRRNTYTKTYYDMSGNVLLTVKNVNSADNDVWSVGGKLVVSVEVMIGNVAAFVTENQVYVIG